MNSELSELFFHQPTNQPHQKHNMSTCCHFNFIRVWIKVTAQICFGHVVWSLHMIECSTVMECYWIKKNLLNKFFALHIFELNTNISIEYNMRIELNVNISYWILLQTGRHTTDSCAICLKKLSDKNDLNRLHATKYSSKLGKRKATGIPASSPSK